MKVISLKSPGNISISTIIEPVRKFKEALIRVKSAGICGSDIGAYRGTNPLVTYPRIIGHEIAGEIIEIDENKSGLSKGDKVILDPYLYCGKCYPCSLGRTNCCENLKVIGVHVDGGMQEYISYPDNMLVKVKKDIPWEHIPFAEPLTIALHAIHRSNLKKGEHIAINGAGAIGLLVGLCAISYGAIPIIADVVEERLAFARKLGILHTIYIKEENLIEKLRGITCGRMAEVVVEASGANAAIRNTLDMVSYAGRIAFTGWPKNETPLPTDIITKKELDILGSRVSVGEFDEALSLIANKTIDPGAIISRIIPMEDIPMMVALQSEHPDRYLKINALFQ